MIYSRGCDSAQAPVSLSLSLSFSALFITLWEGAEWALLRIFAVHHSMLVVCSMGRRRRKGYLISCVGILSMRIYSLVCTHEITATVGEQTKSKIHRLIAGLYFIRLQQKLICGGNIY